jgi:hypothetical protein
VGKVPVAQVTSVLNPNGLTWEDSCASQGTGELTVRLEDTSWGLGAWVFEDRADANFLGSGLAHCFPKSVLWNPARCFSK